MSENRIVKVLPAGGWRVRWTWKTEDDVEVTSSSPLVGWGLTDDGIIVPLMTGLDERTRAEEEIYHPKYEETYKLPADYRVERLGDDGKVPRWTPGNGLPASLYWNAYGGISRKGRRY